jgi:hypothetical protein
MQAADLQAAEKTRPRFRHSPHDFVIPSKARNLSFLSPAQPSERFLASLGMTKITTFLAACEACFTKAHSNKSSKKSALASGFF